MNAAALVFCLLSSYLLGSIPSGYLLVKWFKRIDIRDYGSGNIGFTNVLRVSGRTLAIVTILFDAGKGWLAVALLAPLFHGWREGMGLEIFQISAFVGAVAGHIFTVFLGFQGGKGIGPGAGALLALSFTVFIVCAAIWLLVVSLSGYVSLGSMASAAALPFLMYFTRQPPALVIFTFFIALLVITRHKGNIERLLKGKEHRIGP